MSNLGENRKPAVKPDGVSRASAPAPSESVTESLPRGIRIAGAWSWRLLALVAIIVVAVLAIVELRLIVIPILIAILIASLVMPLQNLLRRWHVPRVLATIITLLVTIAVVVGLFYLAITQISAQSGEVKDRAVEGYQSLREWLKVSPLHLDDTQINEYLGQLWNIIKENNKAIWTGALSVGSTVGHVAAGALLTIFSLLFFLLDGPGIWRWVVRLMPRNARAAIDGAGRDGWRALANYSRTQMLVAAMDAVGIAAGAAILGVPMAIPIGVLVFLGAFIPFVGAILTGTIAVFLALVYNGPWQALGMLIIIVGIQQLEGHVFQPILMGNAVKLHPLAVVLVVTAGALVAGIPGALFAVPLAAVVNEMTRYIAGGRWRTPPAGDRSDGGDDGDDPAITDGANSESENREQGEDDAATVPSDGSATADTSTEKTPGSDEPSER
ncbi:AI-2E family transporter [Mycetocola lacteus]|uniref:AI-2E family transporter n=1 Tax=Mycetocola lacteus TaxID=76637 RepID=A0A3L7AYD8_9MICO|nr:AI-2E family transporter [Mycetocola lacteus]RLP80863.1 AI-2E family transporter [Mycetocola lacteus]RLP84648.1 AI-2E family transporter [Mycetocola lacteus]